MQPVVIISGNEGRYREAMRSIGIDAPAASPGSIFEGMDLRGATLLYEIEGAAIEEHRARIRLANEAGARVVAVLEKPDERVRGLLLSEGVPYCLVTGSGGLPAEFLAAMSAPAESPSGSILILDDDVRYRRVLGALAGCFDYVVEEVTGQKDFFNAIEGRGFDLALVHLGAGGFNTGDFVKEALMRPAVRKVPLVPYKDTSAGLYVHELITGLNRLARAILSPEELYGFLLQLLYRKGIFPLVDRLNRAVEFTSQIDFAREGLPRLYFSGGMDIFSLDNMVSDDRTGEICGTVKSIRRLLVRLEAVRWLARGEVKKATCGLPGV